MMVGPLGLPRMRRPAGVLISTPLDRVEQDEPDEQERPDSLVVSLCLELFPSRSHMYSASCKISVHSMRKSKNMVMMARNVPTASVMMYSSG